MEAEQGSKSAYAWNTDRKCSNTQLAHYLILCQSIE